MEARHTMATRATRRERAQTDLDELLGRLASVAKALIIRNGEFFPFGATIGSRGKFALVTPVPESERPTAHDVANAVLAEIRDSSKTIRAYAIVAMAESSEGREAVRLELEHEQGSALVISLPYAVGEWGAFAYGDMEAHRSAPRVWTPAPSDESKTRKAKTQRSTPSIAGQGVLFGDSDESTPAATNRARAPKGDATAKRRSPGTARTSSSRKVRGSLHPQPA